MKNLCKATLFRVFHSKGMWIIFLMTAAAAALYYVLAAATAQGAIPTSQAGSVTALGDAMILWLFGSLMIGMLIGTDFENKMIHAIIMTKNAGGMRGSKRSGRVGADSVGSGGGRLLIVLHYLIVYLVCMTALTLPYLIGSILCLAAGVDMNGVGAAEVAAVRAVDISVYLDNLLKTWDGYPAGKMALAYLSYGLVCTAQISISIPVAIRVRKPVVVTAFGFFFGMVTALLSTAVAKIEVLDHIYRLTPYAYGLDKINLDGSYSDMLAGILVSLVFLGGVGAVSWLLFRRADVK